MRRRIIQVRLSRDPRWPKPGRWKVLEAEGVSPVYCGEHGRESALSYARQRAGFGHYETPSGTLLKYVLRRACIDLRSARGQRRHLRNRASLRVVRRFGSTII